MMKRFYSSNLTMRTINIICWCILNVCFIAAKAQTDAFYLISGTVKDETTGLPLHGTHVLIKGTFKGVVTDDKGNYRIAFQQQNPVLVFSFIGYKTLEKTIKEHKSQTINVALERETQQLPEAIVYPEQDAKKLIKDVFHIRDYVLADDGILLVGFRGKASNSFARLTDTDGKILSQQQLKTKKEQLFCDCMGNIHLLTSDSSFQVFIDKNKITIYAPFPNSKFEEVLKPCIAKADRYLYFQQFAPGRQSAVYYAVDSISKQRITIKEITDEHKQRMWEEEHNYLLSKYGYTVTNAGVAKTAEELHTYRAKELDKLFAKEIIYTDIYVPLKIINDTLYIFDHINNEIEVFTLKGDRIKVVSIDYHHKYKGWGMQILVDKEAGKVYGLYLKGSITSLAEININNGKVMKWHQLVHSFASNIQVGNGNVYYIYKQVSGHYQQPNLYKQRLH